MTQEQRTCQQCKNEFIIKSEDVAFYGKMNVPPPDACPDCRQQKRILFRNFKTLYKSTSVLSGKSIISMYTPSSPYRVYDHSEWWSEEWDPKSYAKEIDFSRPFFEQFNELLCEVPKFNTPPRFPGRKPEGGRVSRILPPV